MVFLLSFLYSTPYYLLYSVSPSPSLSLHFPLSLPASSPQLPTSSGKHDRWYEPVTPSRRDACVGVGGFLALGDSDPPGLGNPALLHWGSPGQGQRASGTFQQRTGEDPRQAGTPQTAERGPTTHGPDAQVSSTHTHTHCSCTFSPKS